MELEPVHSVDQPGQVDNGNNSRRVYLNSFPQRTEPANSGL